MGNHLFSLLFLVLFEYTGLALPEVVGRLSNVKVQNAAYDDDALHRVAPRDARPPLLVLERWQSSKAGVDASRPVLRKRATPVVTRSETEDAEQSTRYLSNLRRSNSLPTKLDGVARDPIIHAAGAKRAYKQSMGLQPGRAISPTANLRGMQVHDEALVNLFQQKTPKADPRRHLGHLLEEREDLMNEARESSGQSTAFHDMQRVLNYRDVDHMPADHGLWHAHLRLEHLGQSAGKVREEHRLSHEMEYHRQMKRLQKWQDVHHMQSKLGEKILEPALRQARINQLESHINEAKKAVALQQQRERHQRELRLQAEAAVARSRDRQPGSTGGQVERSGSSLRGNLLRFRSGKSSLWAPFRGGSVPEQPAKKPPQFGKPRVPNIKPEATSSLGQNQSPGSGQWPLERARGPRNRILGSASSGSLPSIPEQDEPGRAKDGNGNVKGKNGDSGKEHA